MWNIFMFLPPNVNWNLCGAMIPVLCIWIERFVREKLIQYMLLFLFTQNIINQYYLEQSPWRKTSLVNETVKIRQQWYMFPAACLLKPSTAGCSFLVKKILMRHEVNSKRCTFSTLVLPVYREIGNWMFSNFCSVLCQKQNLWSPVAPITIKKPEIHPFANWSHNNQSKQNPLPNDHRENERATKIL